MFAHLNRYPIRPSRPIRSPFRPRLEALEDRSVPSVVSKPGPLLPPVLPDAMAVTVNAQPPAALDGPGDWFFRSDVGSPAPLQASDEPGLVGAGSDNYISLDSPESVPGGQNWMSHIDGQLPLSMLNIPGTHDSGARYGILGSTAWGAAQYWRINEQLNAGIRFLDIRCYLAEGDNKFDIYHSALNQHLSFDQVLQDCTNFLRAHPSETILMSVKQEHSSQAAKDFVNVFKGYMSRYQPKDGFRGWYNAAQIPKLDAVRGKIVVVSRVDTLPGLPWKETDGKQRLIQDEYEVFDRDNKWGEVKKLLEGAATDSNLKHFYINFTSGVGVWTPADVASAVNKYLFDDVSVFNNKRLGTIVMDFPGEGLIQRIIRTNASLEAYCGKQVDDCYLRILGRKPTQLERVQSGIALRDGGTVKDLVYNLLVSREFQSKFATDASYVEKVFRLTLSRAPSRAEAVEWRNLLILGATRADFLNLFLNRATPAAEGDSLSALLKALRKAHPLSTTTASSIAVDGSVPSPPAGASSAPITVAVIPPGAAPAPDLAFLSQQGNGSPEGALSMVDYGGAGEGMTADVQGVLFGDRDADCLWSAGEQGLSGRRVRLVDGQGAVVAEAATGPDGEYRFAGVPAGRYRVETESGPAWAGAASAVFAVDAEAVTVDPLALPPVGDAVEKDSSPTVEGTSSLKALDAYWALLGAALPIFHNRKDRRSAAEVSRPRAR
jgi:1-phosphatidylinositol phosphodiesterase